MSRPRKARKITALGAALLAFALGACGGSNPTGPSQPDPPQTILRHEIDELAGTGKSLMPEGVEQKVTPNEMADLLAWLLREL